MAGTTAVVLTVSVVLLTGNAAMLRWFHAGNRALSIPSGAASPVADQVVYTARTANDAAITLPAAIQQRLAEAGDAHESVALTEVGYTGGVSTSYVDMTPRTGDSSQDPVLKVAGRAAAAIDAKVAGIETAVNTPMGGTGGRALYVGLTRIDFTTAPVTIVSSGIDLTNPDDFRSLNWSVPVAQVVAQVTQAGYLPVLHGPVTFVLVPTAGSQPQLGQEQKAYLKAVWTALLTAAGATSVTFIDADPAGASASSPAAPAVQVPGPPPTPIAQVRRGNGQVTCTVADGFFVYDTARLIDAAKTTLQLTPCVKTALAAHATFALDGWASYEGPLNADGQPPVNEPGNIRLSDDRVTTIARLLINDLGVPRSDITRMTGHGNLDQPDPNPRSAANRVVVITYTAK